MRRFKSFVALFVFAGSVLGQTNTATLRGIVTDPAAASVPEATVTALHVASGLARNAKTEAGGGYELTFLPPGEFILTIEKPGFQIYRQQGIILAAGETKRQDVSLTVGSTSESVTVTANVTALQNETAMMSASIQPQRIQSLPLLGRNFNALISIQPGVTTQQTGNGLTFSINGGPSGTGFNITLDGTDATAVSTQRVAVARNGFQQTNTTSLESVSEIRVYTNLYSADIGRATSGSVNVVTKSGTNQMHFGLFEYLRNSVLNANSTTANAAGLERAPLRLNQFGANVSGPVIRDRTFFWAGWEGVRQRRGRTSNYTVLSDAGRAAIQDAAIRAYTEEWIPRANQPPIAANPLAALRIVNEVIAVREDIGTARVDHSVTQRNNLFFRFNILNADTSIPFFFSPKTQQGSNSRQYLYTLNDTHSFSPTIVNELRVGANRFVTPQLNPGPQPTITVQGGFFATLGSDEVFANTAYNVNETLFIQKGRHGIRAGAEWRQVVAGRRGNGNSNFVFANLNDFFFNRPQQYNVFQRYGGSAGLGGSLAFFIQDDYKVNSRLTLNLGMRYDYFFLPSERTGRSYNILSGIPPVTGLRFNRTGEAMYNIRDLNNYGPRFGFAFSLTPKTVLRGGYGIFFAPQQASIGVTTSANATQPFLSDSEVDRAFVQPATQLRNTDAPLVFPRTEYNFTYTPPSPNVFDPNYRENYGQQWNLTLEREIARDSVISLGYVASKNNKVEGTFSTNLPRPLLGNTREDPRFTNINYRGPLNNANYHSMQATFTQRLRAGLAIDANYVWSHSIDDFQGFDTLNDGTVRAQNQQDFRSERGESAFDARHSFKMSAQYQFPFRSSNRSLNAVISGWAASAIVTARTGNPYTVLTGGSVGDGLNFQRPNLTGAPFTAAPQKLNEQVLNRASFAVPTAVDPSTGYRLGSLGKSPFTAPGFKSFDLSAQRNFRIMEKLNLQFRAEFFNTLNLVNYNAPVSTLNNPNFGRIIGAGSPREIQFGLKLNY